MTERASRRSRVVRSAIHAELSDERRFYSPIDRSRLRCVSLSLPPSLSLSLSLSLFVQVPLLFRRAFTSAF